MSMRQIVGFSRNAVLPTMLSLLAGGCCCSHTANPQYVAQPFVVPVERLALSAPPIVKTRMAGASEGEAMLDYPGKAQRDASRLADDVAAGTLVVLFAPIFLPMMLGSSAPTMLELQRTRIEDARKHNTEVMPSQLREKIERQLIDSPPDTSALLEVVLFADWQRVPSSGHELQCWFLHARVTLHLTGTKRYDDVIRIDPFARSADAPTAECAGPEGVLDYVDAIPGMLVTRLPGLPWKAATIAVPATTGTSSTARSR